MLRLRRLRGRDEVRYAADGRPCLHHWLRVVLHLIPWRRCLYEWLLLLWRRCLCERLLLLLLLLLLRLRLLRLLGSRLRLPLLEALHRVQLVVVQDAAGPRRVVL